MKLNERSKYQFYEENIEKFLADEKTFYMEFDSSDCCPAFFDPFLMHIGFQPINKVRPSVHPYFIPFRIDNILLYLHVNPLTFQIGLLKDEALNYLCFKDQEFRRPLIFTASCKIQEHNYIDDALYWIALYNGLKPFTRCLCSYHDSLLNSLRPAGYRDRKEAEQLLEIL